MATVVFYFDSTLVTCESLEEVIKSKIQDESILEEIRKITNQGMSGEIDFVESLQKRLALGKVTRQDFVIFAPKIIDFVTPGMEELIKDLKSQYVDIWVISGAFRDLLIPLANKLNIPQNKLLGIDLQWNTAGEYLGLDTSKKINRSKWEGAKDVLSKWSSPKIAVGDGITDYALLKNKCVDHFIAFTGNVRRESIINEDVVEANSVSSLRLHLNEILYG